MTTDELERLRLAAEDAAGGPPSVEQVEALVDLVDALEAALAALTTPQEGDARERVVEYLRTQNVFTGETSTKVAEEQTRKIFAILAAFPVLSRDIAGEIEAEAQSVLNVDDGSPHYRAGLERAAEIARGI